MDKFDWQATEGAPRNYPMEIVGGSLVYHDDSGSLYVPNKATLDNGWGTGRSSHIGGPDLKPLPKQLAITFFSYTENQFYQGRFDLPYDKILKLFQEGYASPRNNIGHITYDAAVVGVAPGGAVAVWLRGIGKTTEVFFGQAEKVEGNWSSISGNAKITREEFIRKVIQESLKTPEALAALRQNGIPFGLWNTYRTRYPWQPVLTGIGLRDGRISSIKYFNGEQDYLHYPLETSIAASTRAIPRELTFVGAPPGAKAKLVELYFNETEIFDAFKKLGSNHQALQLEMRLDPDRPAFFGPGRFSGVVDGQNGFSLWLRNDKESIELKRTEIKTYNT